MHREWLPQSFAAEVQVSDSNISYEMAMEVVGPIKVRYFDDYRTDSDPADSRFEFVVDDAPYLELYGDGFINFQKMLAGIGPGTHRIAWRYVRNLSFRAGQFARVDRLEFVPPGSGSPACVTQPHALLDPMEGEPLDHLATRPAPAPHA